MKRFVCLEGNHEGAVMEAEDDLFIVVGEALTGHHLNYYSSGL